jgi:hypothetical protein
MFATSVAVTSMSLRVLSPPYCFSMSPSAVTNPRTEPIALTTCPLTSVATSFAWSIRKVPLAFSPVSTSIGMVSLVLPSSAKSAASRSKFLKYSKPARMPPGRAYSRA